jgi:hypothetical protein
MCTSRGSELGAALGNKLDSVIGNSASIKLGTALGSELRPPLKLGIELGAGTVRIETKLETEL